MESVAQRLKKLRMQCGVSQRALGEMVGMGQGGISAYENRDNQISVDMRIAIAKALELPPLVMFPELDGEQQPETIFIEKSIRTFSTDELYSEIERRERK